MNVGALIFAVIGASFNLLQGFIAVPYVGNINFISIIMALLADISSIPEIWNSCNGMGEKIIFLIVILIIIGFLSLPFQAIYYGFRALNHKDDALKELIGLSTTSLAIAALLFLGAQSIIESARSDIGVLADLIPSHSVLLSYVPLIWAAFYAISAVCAYADKQNQKSHQEQLDKMNEILAGQKSQPAVSPENLKVTENIAKPETTHTEKIYEPVLGVETEALIKRANIFLEDEDFEEADRYFEQALNQDPENSKAYIGKLLVAKKVHNIDELLNLPVNLADEKLFQRALKFADGEEKNRLEGYVQAINAKVEENERIEREKAELAKAEEAEREQQRKEALYNEAISLKDNAENSEDLRHVIGLLKELGDYKDAPDMIRVLQKDFEEIVTKELKQAGVPPMFQNMCKNLKMSQVENDISISENNKQERTSKVSAEAEKTEKTKTKTGIISVVVLVLILGGALLFSNKGQRREVSDNSTSSTTTPPAQSVHMPSNTENQPVKTKTEEASEYYSAGEEAYKEKNYQKAFENFTKAAELGNGEAQFSLARMYHEGEGVEKNLERSFYWLNKAHTTKPNYRIKFLLGGALYEGEGVDKDYKRAFSLFKEVAEIKEKDETGYTLEVLLGTLSPQMIAYAQMLVGAMYADGNGVERDYNQAEYWLKKSIEGGNNQAKELLDKLQSKWRSKTITQPSETELDIPDISKELDELVMEFIKRENIPSSIVANGYIFVSRSYTSQFKAIDGDTAYILSEPDTFSGQPIFKLENGAKVIADAEYTTKDGARWYYVHFGNIAKGWVLAQYIVEREPDDNSSNTNNAGRQAKIKGEIIIKTKSGGKVNVRSKPSTKSEIVGKAETGVRCSITRRATDEKGYTWYFVEEDYSLGIYGWVRGDLCKVIRITNE